MRNIIFLVLHGCLFTGCNNVNTQEHTRVFKNFDFSYSNGLTECFSIKFTSHDTVFMKERFTQIESEISTSDETTYSYMSKSEQNTLDSLINKLDIAAFDTSYDQSTANIRYQFFFERDSTRKLIYVHSDNIPSELKYLQEWIVKLKHKLKLITIDTTLNFGSLTDFLPPPIYKPSIQILNPRFE